MVIVLFSVYVGRNRRKGAMHLYKQISNLEERQILEAVKALKKDQANDSNIVSKYNEISGKDIKIERLHKKLVEAEEAGLVESKIIHINDEPYLTWKTNF